MLSNMVDQGEPWERAGLSSPAAIQRAGRPQARNLFSIRAHRRRFLSHAKHKHTYIHTYIHTRMRTYMHTYKQTYIHTYIDRYTHRCMLSPFHPSIHTSYAHAFMHTCVHIYVIQAKHNANSELLQDKHRLHRGIFRSVTSNDRSHGRMLTHSWICVLT